MENLTAVLYKTDDLRLEDRPVPEPGHGQVSRYRSWSWSVEKLGHGQLTNGAGSWSGLYRAGSWSG
jgi:hypothetical protein